MISTSEPNVIGEIKSIQLSWLENVERIGEHRAAKKAYLGQLTGDDPERIVAKDLKELKLPEWLKLAQDRKK